MTKSYDDDEMPVVSVSGAIVLPNWSHFAKLLFSAFQKIISTWGRGRLCFGTCPNYYHRDTLDFAPPWCLPHRSSLAEEGLGTAQICYFLGLCLTPVTDWQSGMMSWVSLAGSAARWGRKRLFMSMMTSCGVTIYLWFSLWRVFQGPSCWVAGWVLPWLMVLRACSCLALMGSPIWSLFRRSPVQPSALSVVSGRSVFGTVVFCCFSFPAEGAGDWWSCF